MPQINLLDVSPRFRCLKRQGHQALLDHSETSVCFKPRTRKKLATCRRHAYAKINLLVTLQNRLSGVVWGQDVFDRHASTNTAANRLGPPARRNRRYAPACLALQSCHSRCFGRVLRAALLGHRATLAFGRIAQIRIQRCRSGQKACGGDRVSRARYRNGHISREAFVTSQVSLQLAPLRLPYFRGDTAVDDIK